jgi:metallo-beta-lactamase family protein
LPLYTVAEVQPVLERFQEIPRSERFAISPQFSVRPHDAGHILGSSSLELTITENSKSFVVLFSGDLGRYDQPILKDPEPPPRADFLLCESTYGDRNHPTDPPPEDALAAVVNRVAQRGGVMVIPAFAVGRTQLLMYELRKVEDAGRIPRLPAYVDSPMAISVTDLYLHHREDHDLEFTREEASDGDPLSVHTVHLTRSVEESKQINDVNGPCIIISASGMATGGRVLHHLARRLPDSRNAVILAGFQAEGTRGRALLEGAKTLRIHGEDVPVKAEVVELKQFSAHADRGEILRWLSGMPAPPRQTFLIHGEPAAASALQGTIQSKLSWRVALAEYRQGVELSV